MAVAPRTSVRLTDDARQLRTLCVHSETRRSGTRWFGTRAHRPPIEGTAIAVSF
jgi:hypothetical protein